VGLVVGVVFSFQFSVFSFQFSVFSFQFSVFSFQFSVFSFQRNHNTVPHPAFGHLLPEGEKDMLRPLHYACRISGTTRP